MRGTLLGVLLIPLWTVPIQARAEVANEPLMCRPDNPELDALGYLRALSLDLRGRLPAAEEIAQVRADPAILETFIDAWLATDDFADRAVRAHRAILWNNIQNVNFLNGNQMNMAVFNPGSLYWRSLPALRSRGERVPCLDEPARFDDDGQIQYTMIDGNRREGWVMVEPFWAPGTQIKVCAFDAQAAMVSPTGTPCWTGAGAGDAKCGCGPNLQWCRFGTDYIPRSFAKDVDLRIRALIKEDRPYTELFTSRRAYVNGPLVHFWKNQKSIPGDVRLEPVAIDLDKLPNIPYTEVDTWAEIELPPQHAGVLTSPAFLARFQTNRARAARFDDSFLCSPLSPPPGGLPANAIPYADLQKRDGCKYCHALLEPTGAYWGRWPERGGGFLAPETFPPRRSDCEACGRTGQQCTADCRSYYVTNALSPEEQPFLGMLKSYEFRRDEHTRNVEFGPKLLVLSTIVDNRFPSCVARRAAEGLLGRQLSVDEQPWLNELAMSFLATNYKYRALVKQIVKSDAYRRAR